MGRVINVLLAKPIDGQREISTSQSRLMNILLVVLFRDILYLSK